MPQTEKTAELYRMETPGHLCPYGLKSKDLLRRHGFRRADTIAAVLTAELAFLQGTIATGSP